MTNPVVWIVLGVCLLVDMRLAGIWIVLVGIFAALTMR